MKKPNKIEKEYLVVKRKTELCYYVMKLAEYGELYNGDIQEQIYVFRCFIFLGAPESIPPS